MVSGSGVLAAPLARALTTLLPWLPAPRIETTARATRITLAEQPKAVCRGILNYAKYQNEYFAVSRVVIPESTTSEIARLLRPTCDQYV